LLVEDDPALRELATVLLRKLGYTVLPAAGGKEALDQADHHGERIDLLFTDVVMPDINGKELADRLHTMYPAAKMLFASAYTENAIVHHGVLDAGVKFISKPFTPSALSRKVREVLDS
jgi:CheY-like chemotaxis protein